MSERLFRSDGFTFQRFFVAHDRCPMKVTTDSVILSCWAPLNGGETKILDIGSGCGVIALLLAQRTESYPISVMIDGVEIDKVGAGQGQENAQASPWGDRVSIIHDDIVHYANQHMNQYDLVISNPPYFISGSQCRSEQREKGRYTSALDHQQLLLCGQQLMSEKGRMILILPLVVADTLLVAACLLGWYVGKKLFIRHHIERANSLMAFEIARYPLEQATTQLVLRHGNGKYTQQYYELVSPFQCVNKEKMIFNAEKEK